MVESPARQRHQSTASLLLFLHFLSSILPNATAFQPSVLLHSSSSLLSSTWRDVDQHDTSPSRYHHRRRNQGLWPPPLKASSSSLSSSSSKSTENNFDRPVVNGHHAKEPLHHHPDSIWKTPLGAHFLTLGSNLTPYHIIDPMAAMFMASHQQQSSPCSLDKSLGIFRKALEKLASSRPVDLISSLLPIADNNRILRLELEVSHVVDPLAWLHAQQQRQQTSAIPQVYLKTESLEAAAFGAAYRHTHSSGKTSGNSDHRHSLWQLVQEQLPSNSLMYGGERFDTNTTHMGEEWKRFGQAMWILPAIELRHEQIITTHPSPSPQGDFMSASHNTHAKHPSSVTLAIHLYRHHDDENDNVEDSWAPAAQRALALLQRVSSRVSDATPTTTLPPVLSRESSYYDSNGNGWDGQELYEKGVMAALEEFDNQNLEKVVLARRMDLKFGAPVSALDIIKRWKYGGQEGGHLFYLHPGRIETDEDDDDDDEMAPGTEFFGCTPERLFQIQRHTNMVLSEALAGTRPRGTTQQADEALSRDLCASTKDVQENMITGRYIQKAFTKLSELGWISYRNDGRDGLDQLDQEECVLDNDSRFFVRRLRHLQHICQRFEGAIQDVANGVDVARFLMDRLHPTPAVAGYPSNGALDFIRQHESIGFDRGYYSGPFGYIGPKSADILVAIRSGLVSPSRRRNAESKVSLYAGAGVVPGSTVHGEWAETSYKLEVVSSLFPQSPITLQSAPTPNVAWATAFLEELIRQGVTQFYVCPGSRSTPLVVALAKAVRSNVGVVRAISVHDERGAGFRAVGYARGAHRPAAVITSSGTATANLYPSIMEAGVDGVPMLILTADRPYENRDTGANQAVDQVKAYSSSYIRWFRDILPPSDDVPVSVALSDAGHAVNLARKLKGPVHLNIQFRENLAPDGGPIRNDNRADSATKFNGFRFIDCPGFQRWSTGGGRWSNDFSAESGNEAAVYDVARLISQSSRGIIVVGNVRQPTNERENEETSQTMEAIAAFAQFVGFPIIAGVQAAGLRFTSEAVIPFAEHLLKHPVVAENLKPDLILQVGAPLVSSDVANMITSSMKNSESQVQHVLLHPHHPYERADPSFTVSLAVSTEISPFLQRLSTVLENDEFKQFTRSSDLSPLILLGKKLRDEMEQIIHQSSKTVTTKYGLEDRLTEPQVVLALSQSLTTLNDDMALFLSNSMPVRDAESFLYPFVDTKNRKPVLTQVGVNRGASGIDGIISSAAGFAEATQRPTTLLIGDLAALHDLNALHTLSRTSSQISGSPLTTVVVNNDGGGIFSFLPIAKYGSDVSFEDFFGTATSSFSFGKGVEAFGLPFKQATTFASLQDVYRQATAIEQPSVVEAVVTSRDVNVAVHREITKKAIDLLNALVGDESKIRSTTKLPIKIYSRESFGAETLEESFPSKTMVLLHGWMGEKSDWDDVGTRLVYALPHDWTVIAVDLPGHGDAPEGRSSDVQVIKSALGPVEKLPGSVPDASLSIDQMASCILESLSRDYGVRSIDAIAGYSLGGRVALAMKRLGVSLPNEEDRSLMRESTKMILISANPGNVEETDTVKEDRKRLVKDERLAASIEAACKRGNVFQTGNFDQMFMWTEFLRKWYNAPIWGKLPNERTQQYQTMITKRWKMLARKGRDLGAVIQECSPARQSGTDWKLVSSESTLFVAGHLDAKYSQMGKVWSRKSGTVRFIEIPKAGHGLLVEASAEVAESMCKFLEEDYLPVKGFQANPTESLFESSSGNDFTLSIFSGSFGPSGDSLLVLPDENTQMLQTGDVGSLEYKPFSIPMSDSNRNEPGVFGIGWGEKAQAIPSLKLKSRSGFILHLLSRDGGLAGIGEVSPLPGLHSESFTQAEEQLMVIQSRLRGQNVTKMPHFDAGSTLRLNGAVADFISQLSLVVGVPKFLPSVRSGIEMALVSLAAQVVGTPVDQAILHFSPLDGDASFSTGALPLNGIITRGQASDSSLRPKWLPQMNDVGVTHFPSVKVKVGYQDARQDVEAILRAQSLCGDGGAIRADANRAWSATRAIDFATSIEGIEFILERLEFVEEPLNKQDSPGRTWSFQKQIEALEKWYEQTGIPYALDETLADLAEQVMYDFEKFEIELLRVFCNGRRGCAAFVLKPSLLGLEFSTRLSRTASKVLGIPSVISSSFDSGVGLSYAAFLGVASDAAASNQNVKTFPHGLGTFSNLAADTMSPPFASYVNADGVLNVASLGRALYGLSLDEIRTFGASNLPTSEPTSTVVALPADSEERRMPGLAGTDYEASMSTNGRETNVMASLPLPFSASIASSRFTDLPQQPRWSPWLSCVAYLDAPGRETEWTLNVRGAKFSWRAISRLLETPNEGIVWESVSGLQHRGVVEFAPISSNSCLMRVRMTIIVPRIIATLFQGASVFLEDFLQSKLLKWSMEMFRDVVKGDLALERGDVELGDALFGAVEGKASAIEATLSSTTVQDGDRGSE